MPTQSQDHFRNVTLLQPTTAQVSWPVDLSECNRNAAPASRSADAFMLFVSLAVVPGIFMLCVALRDGISFGLQCVARYLQRRIEVTLQRHRGLMYRARTELRKDAG